MVIENIETGMITPYDKNAKAHPDEQIERIMHSIKEFGFQQPLVVDKDNVIIVGHGRHEAARRLGIETLPCIVLETTEDKAKAYRLADNKLNESEWDMKLVIEELKELDDDLIDATGFDRDLLYDKDLLSDDKPEVEFTREILEENNYLVFTFDNVMDWNVAKENFDLKTVKALDDKESYQRRGTGRVLDGKDLLKRI